MGLLVAVAQGQSNKSWKCKLYSSQEAMVISLDGFGPGAGFGHFGRKGGEDESGNKGDGRGPQSIVLNSTRCRKGEVVSVSS